MGGCPPAAGGACAPGRRRSSRPRRPRTTTMRVRAMAPPHPRLPEASLSCPWATTEKASVARMLFHCTHGRDDPRAGDRPVHRRQRRRRLRPGRAGGPDHRGRLAVQARLRRHRPGRRLPRLARAAGLLRRGRRPHLGLQRLTTPVAPPSPTWSAAPRSSAAPPSWRRWPRARSRSPSADGAPQLPGHLGVPSPGGPTLQVATV
jgi:hypothetical protein